MPKVDPVARREGQRQYYERNKQVLKAKRRARYDPESAPARAAAARARLWREDNPDRVKANRARWAVAENRAAFRRRHGPEIDEDWAAFWVRQNGLCYLCENALTPETADVDHDHACCPARRSCRKCRRGLACGRCNRMIGKGGDDPDLLELVARNLRRVAGPVRARIAAAAAQEWLF